MLPVYLRLSGVPFESGRGSVTLLATQNHHTVVSPDGRYAALAVDGEVEVWGLQTGTRAHRLTGHGGLGMNVTAAYNPDGTRLFTLRVGSAFGGSGDEGGANLLHYWDTATGRELLTIPTTTDRRTLRGSRIVFKDGKRIIHAAGLMEVVGRRLVRVPDGTPVAP